MPFFDATLLLHGQFPIDRRYVIVDEAMQREAAARLDAWVQSPPPAVSTGTISTFTPKAAKVTKPRRQRSA